MHTGYLCLFLHAHLPFVRHPEEEIFLEENWLYEAITETYIPLLDIFERLTDEGIPFRVTMSLTPTLASMLQDPLLQDRYVRHIGKLIELADKEIGRTAFMPEYHDLALMYHRRFVETRDAFVNKYDKDLVAAFKRLQDKGSIEIVASCATHGFLPNLRVNPTSVRAQIGIGCDFYRKIFGVDPRGFWLPECGYYPGVDEVLQKEGIRYFFVDTHGLLNADPAPRYSVYAPVYCPSGVAAFGRDWESSKQVWSSKAGYPGDPDYREYYRDIGWELEYDYVKPYIHPDGFRINTGIKYWRITGPGENKEPYRPDWALKKAGIHAGNFMFNREKQIEHLASTMDRKPLVVAPYDAELFGHWWYEGPQFIELLARKIATEQKTLRMITPTEYLNEYPVNVMAVPSESSWGFKGYAEYWLDGKNDWLYRHIHAIGGRMAELARKFSSVIQSGPRDSLQLRALNQAARELVLAESSDWPFIMRTGTMVPYANKRVKLHVARFLRLFEDLTHDTIDEQWLKEAEWRDIIFYDMECARYYLDGAGAQQKPALLVKKVKQPSGRAAHKIPRSKTRH